jgi:hypothetical protein
VLDLGRYFETADETLLPKVLPGDTIYIPAIDKPWLDESKERTVRVLGAIAKPGRYEFNEQMTLLDLLAEAGGPSNGAYVEKIVVVNYSHASEGEDQSRTFNLSDFSKNPDFSNLPVVRAGDTIFVPEASSSHWSVFMTAVKDALSVLLLVAVVGGL